MLADVEELGRLGLLEQLELDDLLLEWTAVWLRCLWSGADELVQERQWLWLLEFELLIAKFYDDAT